MLSAKPNKATGDIWLMWVKGKLVTYNTCHHEPEGLIIISHGGKVYQCMERTPHNLVRDIPVENMPPETKAALMLNGFSW